MLPENSLEDRDRQAERQREDKKRGGGGGGGGGGERERAAPKCWFIPVKQLLKPRELISA